MKKYILPLILILASGGSAFADSVYDLLIATVLFEANPELKASQLRIEADVAAQQADNLPAGPELEFEHLWGASSDDVKWNAGISQEFDFPGAYRARSRAIKANEAAATGLFGLMALDKALAAKEAIIDMINAKNRLQLYQEILDNCNSLLRATQRSYDLGEATILELQKARLARADALTAITIAETERENRFAALLGMGFPADIAHLDWRQYPLQNCEPDSASIMNEFLNSQVEAARAAAHASKLSSLPSLAIGYRHAYEERQHFNGFTIALKLPSWGIAKRRKEMELRTQAAVAESSTRSIEYDAEQKALYRSAKELEGRIATYRNILDDNSYLDLLAKAFDGGELNVLDYLREMNLYAESRASYLDLLYRYNLTLARLNRYKSICF